MGVCGMALGRHLAQGHLVSAGEDCVTTIVEQRLGNRTTDTARSASY